MINRKIQNENNSAILVITTKNNLASQMMVTYL